jgi:hypothetical protein
MKMFIKLITFIVIISLGSGLFLKAQSPFFEDCLIKNKIVFKKVAPGPEHDKIPQSEGVSVYFNEISNQFEYLDVDGITKKVIADTNKVSEMISRDLVDNNINLKEGVFNVLDYGAVNNGLVDCTNSIDSALIDLASNGGGTLLFPPGTYKVTANITQEFSDNAHIKISGYGAKLDASSITSYSGDALIVLGGSVIDTDPLATSVSKNATSIVSTTDFGIQSNDIVLLTSTDLWNPTRAYYYKGELAKVRSINTTTINLSKSLYDSYTNTTTTIQRLAMPSILIEGLEIEMNMNSGVALTMYYTRDVEISHCKIHGAKYAGIVLYYCFGGSIHDNYMYDNWYTGTGTSYNISISSSQHIKVMHNTLYEARHNITTGGHEPNRDILMGYNDCLVHPSQSGSPSIDTHGNTEFVTIIGNHTNGMSMSAINVIIIGNDLKTYKNSNEILTINQEVNSSFYIINDNVINNEGSSSYGIYITPTVANLNIDKLFVHGNIASAGVSAFDIQPRNTGITGCSINLVDIKDNSFTSSTGSAFYVNRNTPAVYTITKIKSSGNTYKSTAYDAFTIIANSIVSEVSSSFDEFYCGRNSGNVLNISGVTNANFYNDYFKGVYGNEAYLTLDVDSVISMFNSRMIDIQDVDLSSNVYKYIENGRIVENSPLTVDDAGTNQLISSIGLNGKNVGYGTAAPTIGTWAVGDRIYNSNPSSGNPTSWICVTAGTPGVWLSDASLGAQQQIVIYDAYPDSSDRIIIQHDGAGSVLSPSGDIGIRLKSNKNEGAYTQNQSARVITRGESSDNYGSWIILQVHGTATSENYVDALKINPIGGIGYPFVNTGNVVAANGIIRAHLARNIYYNGNSAIDIISDPQIIDGFDGQIITFVGSSDTNTLTFDNGTGVVTKSGSSIILGIYDTVTFLYNASLDVWIEN